MIINGDCLEVLKTLPPDSVDVIFTSPNAIFYQYQHLRRKVGEDPQEIRDTVVGAETDNFGYLNHLIHIIDELQKVLKPRGSLLLQLGDYHDNYGDNPTGAYRLVPEILAVAMQKSKWHCMGKIIWYRPIDFKIAKQQTKGYINDWEYLFHFTKQPFPNFEFNKSGNRFWATSIHQYDEEVIKHPYESGFPTKLIEGALSTVLNKEDKGKAVVLDPMAGGGTTGLVAKRMGYRYIMIEYYKWLCEQMQERLQDNGDIVELKSVEKFIRFDQTKKDPQLL